MLRLDVLHPHAVDAAETLLAQRRIGDAVQPQLSGDRLCGLPSAQQVAGVQAVCLFAGQALGQPPCLLHADGIQPHVHVSLETQLAIPVGLAVAQEDQFGHDLIIRPHPLAHAVANVPTDELGREQFDESRGHNSRVAMREPLLEGQGAHFFHQPLLHRR